MKHHKKIFWWNMFYWDKTNKKSPEGSDFSWLAPSFAEPRGRHLVGEKLFEIYYFSSICSFNWSIYHLTHTQPFSFGNRNRTWPDLSKNISWWFLADFNIWFLRSNKKVNIDLVRNFWNRDRQTAGFIQTYPKRSLSAARLKLKLPILSTKPPNSN